MANGGAAAAAAAAAAIQAVKASGVLVKLKPEEFQSLLRKSPTCLVVHSEGWLFGARHKYLLPYKGLAFYTACREPISLPPGAEQISAGRIWTP